MHALETLEELLAILFLHFSSLVFTQLHLWVHFSATEILSCPPFILSQTWLLTLSSAASADIPACSFFVSSPLLVLSLHFLLLAYGSIFSMSALHFSAHRSPMQDCKHKAHNCSLWPYDFLVIAITMLAGLLMSPYSSLCPRSSRIQIKKGK